MSVNSSDLLEVIREISVNAGENIPIDVRQLAGKLDMSLPKLITVLTELEHRDEITLEVKTSTDPASGELLYEGTARLMEHGEDDFFEENDIKSLDD